MLSKNLLHSVYKEEISNRYINRVLHSVLAETTVK